VRSYLICWLAVVLSACSGSARENAAVVPATDRPERRSTATPTLDDVRSKDFVQCGVTTGVAGFSTPNAQGEWRGLDVDVCRAIAAEAGGE
jgi:ABC-type amino acid transport substrate-binding protein